MEVYKIITDFPDYEISNLGNCRNIKTQKILKPKKCKIGYFDYSLSYTDDSGKRKQKGQYQHRLIGQYFIDNPYNKPDIDHIDRNKGNNNIDNLRWVSKSENMCNQSKALNKTSNYMGVCFDKTRNKWTSHIEVNKIRKRFGRYDTEKDASDARDEYIKNNNLIEFFNLNSAR